MKYRSLLATLSLCLFLFLSSANAAQTDIVGPAGSGNFGGIVTVLPNGNIVVVDPSYDLSGPTVANVGAVHLYDGTTLALISTLTGSAANDLIGLGDITILTNGNFVVRSQNWNGNRGAVTFVNGTTGLSGTISSANSLVGSAAGDQVGIGGVTALTNGNYVVPSPNWDNGAITNAGAVTWGNGTTGTVGAVSNANSLVGSSAGDQVGSGVTALTNGNYVVRSTLWRNGAINAAGAVTWCNGTTGTVGAVSNANSLVGSSANDVVGNGGVTALTNGNYVVRSVSWDNGAIINAGAVTWGNGLGGTVGAVSSANSLVGSTASDSVGTGVTALANGNYVVRSQNWDNGAITDAGAVTWGNGAGGTVGAVSSANSLVGSSAGDALGGFGVVALTNGNYVVLSTFWDNTSPLTADVGAVTWGNGLGGTIGTVSSTNSLVGSTAFDQVGGNGITLLPNGNYVISSGNWDSGAVVNAGAVTWGNGLGGTVGAVSSANSLVGSTANDGVGSFGVVALTNGNYVVCSPNWDSGAITNVGAATWGNGAGGTVGAVSSANSLVGSTTNDSVGAVVIALTNGNYVVSSGTWDNGVIANAGAVTWGNGLGGTIGTVSSANSLVGSSATDQIGGVVTALTNGNYVVGSQNWDNGAIINAGAVTWGNGGGGTVGAVSSANSLVGSTAGDGVGGVTALTNGNYVVSSANWDNGAIADAGAITFGSGAGGTVGVLTNGTSGGNSVLGTVINGGSFNVFAFDPTRNRLIVGRSKSNTVSILSFTTTAIADGDLSNPANWSAGVPNGLVTGIIPSGRTMSISSIMNIGQLRVQCGGTLTGGSASAYIVGSVRGDFCGTIGARFTFPIGDPSNYSPLTVSNTNGTGSLTASVTDDFLPGIAQAFSLSRRWSLEGSGITTNLEFQYVDGDVNGTETSLRVFKRNANVPVTYVDNLSNVDAAANTITAVGVSRFSDWGAGFAPLVPTAAQASVSGRVLTSNGSGVRNAIVQLTDMQGITRTVRTSSFGYYQFDDIDAGQTVTIAVASKRFTFTPRVVTVADNIGDLDLVALTE